MYKIRNIGIVAHVDAGKTTITEQILYRCGALRKLGSVDFGTSATDRLEVEKERGISVKAAAQQFTYGDVKLNLIDTPGHGDFIGEVERSMSVMDGAVLVLSAVEGIEAQTTTLWRYLEMLNLPVIIFINKVDRVNSDLQKVVEDIEKELSADIVLLQKLEKERSSEVRVTALGKSENSWYESFMEKVVEKDDKLLEKYLEGDNISAVEIEKSFGQSCKRGDLYPVLVGSAKNGIGIDELLKGIVKYLPAPQSRSNEFSARIFKIRHDTNLGKLAYLRILSGSLKPKGIIFNRTRSTEEKINQILIPKVKHPEMTKELQAGDVGIVTGLKSSLTGDILGINLSGKQPQIAVSPFLVEVHPQEDDDYSRLAEALMILDQEEPNLEFNWDKEERKFTLNVMGYIHIQILEQTISNRFSIKTIFSDPRIIYKETPLKKAEGYDQYTMPKPCWAVCRFVIEPGKAGSGVEFASEVSVDKIAYKYQKEVRRAIPGALRQGILGWEVTDIKITLIDGEDHEIHSRPGNFTIATNIALMKALEKSKTSLLEPVMNFQITIDEEKCGRVMSDILRMRGSYEPPVSSKGYSMIKGKVPAATSTDYQITLSSISGGKSSFNNSFYGYEPCPIEAGTTQPYRGVNPLDRSKYILKMRGAIIE